MTTADEASELEGTVATSNSLVIHELIMHRNGSNVETPNLGVSGFQTCSKPQDF